MTLGPAQKFHFKSSLKNPPAKSDRDTPVVLWDSQRFGPDAAQDNAIRSGLLVPCFERFRAFTV